VLAVIATAQLMIVLSLTIAGATTEERRKQ
jgi:hypothetical protein